MSEQQQYRLLNPGEKIPEGAEIWMGRVRGWESFMVTGVARIPENPTELYRVPIDPAHGWISVEDQLPTALAADSFGQLLFVFADGSIGTRHWNGHASKTATHWQRLQQPPAVEEKTEDEPEERLTFGEWCARMKAKLGGEG